MAISLTDPGQVQYKKYAQKCLDLAEQKGPKVYAFAQELRRLCKIHGYSFPGMFIQAWHETAGFTSTAWQTRTNPAGIKTRRGTAYQRYYNGVDAARAFVRHMSAYVPPKFPERLNPYTYLDERYQLALDANRGKVYHTYNDLAGKWAEDTTYGTQIDQKYRALLGNP